MATKEIDDLELAAPAPKRMRLEASEGMDVSLSDQTVIAEAPTGKEQEPNLPKDSSKKEVAAADIAKSEDVVAALPAIEASSHILTTHLNATSVEPPLTHALEALLGSLEPVDVNPPHDASVPTPAQEFQESIDEVMENDGTAQPATVDGQEAESKHPEWEADSSPIGSSSDSSSSSESSSDESDDEDNAYKMLSLEEQAKILMEGDGASDDEGGDKKSKGAGSQLRTKNEIPEEVVPKPDVTITPEMPIQELGAVEGIIENVVLIKAKTSGEYRVLETESVLCLEDRSVIGVVSETIGRVQQPFYSVRFTNAEAIAAAKISLGVKVFHSEKHSKYVFTHALKAFKGSDASNLHDEEVGDEEIEFSDDEAEAEHKRRIKQKKSEKRGGKGQSSGAARRGGHGHPLQQQHSPGQSNGGISYDDPDDDGPYKPLARPVGYADSVSRVEAPQEGTFSSRPTSSGQGGYGQTQGRDQSGNRGRGDRGRGRGDRGRGRGGYQDRRGNGSGFSLPAHGHPNGGYTPDPQNAGGFQPQPYQNQQQGFPPTPTSPPASFYNNQMQQQYSPHQPLMPTWHQHPPPPFQTQHYQQSFPNATSGWPNNSQPPMPAGAFLNPAFFSGVPPHNINQWSQQNQQSQHGQQWPQGGGANGNEPR